MYGMITLSIAIKRRDISGTVCSYFDYILERLDTVCEAMCACRSLCVTIFVSGGLEVGAALTLLLACLLRSLSQASRLRHHDVEQGGIQAGRVIVFSKDRL
jgi:hypothetical protein